MSEDAIMIWSIVTVIGPFLGLLCWLQYQRGKTCHEYQNSALQGTDKAAQK